MLNRNGLTKTNNYETIFKKTSKTRAEGRRGGRMKTWMEVIEDKETIKERVRKPGKKCSRPGIEKKTERKKILSCNTLVMSATLSSLVRELGKLFILTRLRRLSLGVVLI